MQFFPAINGVFAVYKKNKAIGKVNQNGKIEVFSFKSKKQNKFLKIPFVRGLAFLLLGLYLFLFSFSGLSKEKIKQKVSKQVVVLTILGCLAAALCIVAMFLIPFFFFESLVYGGINEYVVALLMASVRVGFFVLAVLSLKLVPSVKQFYRNSCAGNLAKTRFENVKINCSNLSTNFLNLIVWGFIISIFVLSFVVAEINFFLKFLINIVILILSFSVCFEILKLFEFKSGKYATLFVNIISFLTSEIPTQTEREIAFSAMNEVVLMHENEERLIGNLAQNGVAFSVVLSEVKRRLESVGILDTAEADWLIASALGKTRSEIKLLTSISKEEYKKIKNILAKREKRMPLSKIFNQACFYGRNFYVDKNVLSPRQETELVVEEAIKEINKFFERPRVLDLMTGSGAIAITVALETNSIVFASDISPLALDVAKKNAKAHSAKIKFFESDLFKGLKKNKFDVIISNPPYIATKEIEKLDDEVKKYDPIISLDGGEDGLYFYREIANTACSYLKESGVLVLEIGFDQGQKVKKLLQKNFKNIRIKKDYSNNDRIVVATRK